MLMRDGRGAISRRAPDAERPERIKAFAKLANCAGRIRSSTGRAGARTRSTLTRRCKSRAAATAATKYKVLTTDANLSAPRGTTGIGRSGFTTSSITVSRPWQFSCYQPLLTAAIDGKDETVAWAWERPDGVAVWFQRLHFRQPRLPEYRRLVVQDPVEHETADSMEAWPWTLR